MKIMQNTLFRTFLGFIIGALFGLALALVWNYTGMDNMKGLPGEPIPTQFEMIVGMIALIFMVPFFSILILIEKVIPNINFPIFIMVMWGLVGAFILYFSTNIKKGLKYLAYALIALIYIALLLIARFI